jgi:hypothetical protein
VYEVGMDQSATKKTVPLVLLCYSWRIKNKVVDDLAVAESTQRHQHGNNND